VRDDDNHTCKDRDSSVEPSPSAGVSPRSAAAARRWRRSQPLRVSFRFLRGLDLRKVALRRRLARQVSLRRVESEVGHSAASHALWQRQLGAAQHRTTWRLFASRTEPDVLIFHSCAWDLPAMNRSDYYYPWEAPTEACVEPAGSSNVSMVPAAHSRWAEPAAPRWLAAPVARPSACIRRAHVETPDDAIYAGARP
jgi:hypothetical protein